MSSPRIGISCRTACRWRARRVTPASRSMSRRALPMAPRRSCRRLHAASGARSCAAGFRPRHASPPSARCGGIHREVAPAIAHHVALQATVLGSLAAWGGRVVCVNALTGLGYTFTSGGAKARLLRPVAERRCCGCCSTRPAAGRAGAESRRPRWHALARHSRRTDRADPRLRRRRRSAATDARAARARHRRLCRAAARRQGHPHADRARTRLLRQRGSSVELLIAGTPDPANPGLGERAARPQAGAASPASHGSAMSTDIASALGARAYRGAAVPARGPAEKPAGGRGLRPADDRDRRSRLPRDRAPGETGLLVPFDDAPALADAIETLGASAELRARYGRGGAAASPSSNSRPPRSAGRRLISIAGSWDDAAAKSVAAA